MVRVAGVPSTGNWVGVRRDCPAGTGRGNPVRTAGPSAQSNAATGAKIALRSPCFLSRAGAGLKCCVEFECPKAPRKPACEEGAFALPAALMAKLYFHYSTMNAGKSTALLQASHNYREGGMHTYLMTANVDRRAGQGRIASRIGIGEDADTFTPEDDMQTKIATRLAQGPVACVFIDEAQFLTKAQVWQLARAVDDLGVPVMCYGLRVDFQGNLFPGSAALLAWADEMREVRTICHCGKKATMVIRRGPDGQALRDGEQVQIGGNETYVSLCRRHWRAAVGD